MGSRLSVCVDAPTREQALQASERAIVAIEAVERRLSTWSTESELARFNRAPSGTRVAVSPELARDLRLARECTLATAGTFDAGIGALMKVWDLRGVGRIADDLEVREALRCGGLIGGLELGDGWASRRCDSLLVEEGGFGKGLGLAEALRALRDAGALGAVLDFGGQVATLGTHSTTWGIADPRDRGRALLSARLDTGSYSTSCNSERTRVVEGRPCGHLLDPRSGGFARDFGSTTVWALDPARADAYSTATFVMGPDSALAWAAGRDDVQLIVIEVLGEVLRVRITPGLNDRVRSVAAGVQVEIYEAVRPDARAPQVEGKALSR